MTNVKSSPPPPHRELPGACMEKGASLGTVLAFMMSVVGLSLPEAIILRRVLKPQLIAIFIGVIGVAIIITGYLFNLIV